MIRLRQKDIERLAIITNGSVDYLTKLVSMSLIDHNYALDLGSEGRMVLKAAADIYERLKYKKMPFGKIKIDKMCSTQ